MIIHIIVLFIIAISVLGVSIANKNTIRYCITIAFIFHTRISMQVVIISHCVRVFMTQIICNITDITKDSLLLFTLLWV